MRHLLLTLVLFFITGNLAWSRVEPDDLADLIIELTDGQHFFIKGIYGVGTGGSMIDPPVWLGVQYPRTSEEDVVITRESNAYVGDAYEFTAIEATGEEINGHQAFYILNNFTGKYLQKGATEGDHNAAYLFLVPNKEEATLFAFIPVLETLPEVTTATEYDIHMACLANDGTTMLYYNNNYNHDHDTRIPRMASFTDGTTWCSLIPARTLEDKEEILVNQLMELFEMAGRYYPIEGGVQPGMYPLSVAEEFNLAYEEGNPDEIIYGENYQIDDLQKAYDRLLAAYSKVLEGPNTIQNGAYYYLINAFTNWAEPEKQRAAFAHNSIGRWAVLEEDNAEYIWQLHELGNGKYAVQNMMSGEFLVKAVRSGAVTLGTDSVPVTCTYLGSGQYNIALTTGNNSLHPMSHNNGANYSGTLTDFPGAANSQSAWYLTPVDAHVTDSLIEVSTRQQRADAKQKELLAKIQEYGAATKAAFEYTIPDDAIDITPLSADDFNSNAALSAEHGKSWGNDGGGYGALIDNDITTHFHTAYSSSVVITSTSYDDEGNPTGTPTSLHNLSMLLAEPADNITFVVTPRGNGVYNNPTKIDVDASHDGVNWTPVFYGYDFFTPTTVNTKSFILGCFDLGDTYEYVRFSNYGNDRNKSGRFFCFSELRVYSGATLTSGCQASTIDKEIVSNFLKCYSDANKYADVVTFDDMEGMQNALDALETAYQAFIGVFADPAELNTTLATADNFLKNFKTSKDQVGCYAEGTDITPLSDVVNGAKEMLEKGYYKQEKVDEFNEAIINAMDKTNQNIIMPDPNKWYQFQYADEDEFTDLEFADGEALIGRVITLAIQESDGYIEPYMAVEEVREQARAYSVDPEEVEYPELTYFRFVPVEGGMYLIQNKATGLFMPYTGNSQNVRMSTIPAMWDITPVGAGFNIVGCYNFFTGECDPASNPLTLHFSNPAQFYELRCWSDHKLATKSSIKIIAKEDGATDEAMGPTYREYYDEELHPTVFATNVSRVTSGRIFGVNGVYEDEGIYYVDLAEKESLKAGEPALIMGYDEAPAIYFGHEVGNQLLNENGLEGTFKDSILVKNGQLAKYAFDLEDIDYMHKWNPIVSTMTDSEAKVNAGDAYLNIEALPKIEEQEGDVLMIIVNYNADGILSAKSSSDAKPQGIYNLKGTKVAETNNLNGLKRGIYIINGKKVLIP